MTGYALTLSNGDSLTTINVKTVDVQAHSSLILIGQGIPDYGQEIAQDFVWLLENFAKTTPPVHPLIGQEWYDRAKGRLNVNTGEWQPLLTPEAAFSAKFDMLVTATNIDFTQTGPVQIFTGQGGKTYCPTFLILVPTGPYTAATGPTFNASISTAGDVLTSTAVAIADSDQYIRLALNTAPRMVLGASTVSLNITVAATGGQLNYNAYLFGFTI